MWNCHPLGRFLFKNKNVGFRLRDNFAFFCSGSKVALNDPDKNEKSFNSVNFSTALKDPLNNSFLETLASS